MANEFEFHPRYEFWDGEPDHHYWTDDMKSILNDTMEGLTKKKQQHVYEHIVALMHIAYRSGYARGCHAGAGDVLNHKAEEDALPLDFVQLSSARDVLVRKIDDANHKDARVTKILQSIGDNA